MSLKCMNWIWQNPKIVNVKGSQLVLLLAIADNADDNGKAFPSITTLAKKCRLSRQSVIDHTSKLEKTGHLAVIAGNRGRSNRYFLTSYRLAHGLDNQTIEKKARNAKTGGDSLDGLTSQVSKTGVVKTGLPSSLENQTVIFNNHHLTTTARAYFDEIEQTLKKRGIDPNNSHTQKAMLSAIEKLETDLSIEDFKRLCTWFQSDAQKWIDFSINSFFSDTHRNSCFTSKTSTLQNNDRLPTL